MGWELFGWSFKALRRNKGLLLFPILGSTAALTAVSICSLFRRNSQDLLWLAPAYFLASLLIVFFNCALATCAQAQFSGENATLGAGMRHAAERIVPILAWALLTTTVGLVFHVVQRRASWAGKLALWLFGFAWGMSTYLVVPVLIAEDRGALDSMRRSAQLVRDTWGDQLVAEIRFGWRGLVLYLPGLLLGIVGMNGHPAVLPLSVAYFVVAAAVLNAAKGVFEVALYRYASGGELPAGIQN